jgi:hypothetical protein
VSSTLVVASGRGGGLFEGNVVVRILDAAGDVLAEQPTVLEGTDNAMGGEGEWRVELAIEATPGTDGTIVALSASPRDGSIVAQDEVSVVFGTLEEEGAIALAIEAPAAFETLPASGVATISGTGRGLFEGALIVRALDSEGHVLAEQPVQLQGMDVGAGAPGTWEAELPISTAPGTQGLIYAYTTSPRDGSLLVAAAVNVVYGEPERPIYVAITDPPPYTQLSDPTFTVSGKGGGLFEGTVAVQALDSDGNILASGSTIMVGQDVGIGGEGEWSLELTVEVERLTSGRLMAFSTSPEDGSIDASFTIDVAFGGPDDGPYITIGSPLPGTPVSGDSVAVGGRGAGLFEGNVVVQARDSGGTVLDQQVATLTGENAGLGGEGDWGAILSLADAEPGELVRVYAFSTSAEDGAVIAAYTIEIIIAPAA